MTLVDLYIVRHSEAEGEHPDNPFDDSMRRLTANGEDRAQRAFKVLADSGLAPDCILHSPFARTTRTAQIANEYLKPRLGTHIESELAVGGSTRSLAAAFDSWDFRKVLLVGHEPMTSDLVSYLVSTDAVVRQHFATGALAHIRLHAVGSRFIGELMFFSTQDQLIAFGDEQR